MQSQQFSETILGTVLTITIADSSSVEEEFFRIRSWLADFESRYSRFIPSNPIDKINSEWGWKMDADMKEMLTFALDLADQTDGYFDPTITPLLESYGYGEQRNPNQMTYGYRNVRIQNDNLILENNVRIELGGVGKGFALEWIAHILDWFDRFLVDFGGDVYARGGWDIALEHPTEPNLSIGTIRIDDGYFCASSGLRRRIGDFHHLLDAHSGKPASEVIASFVESDRGMIADGYATALCVCPLEMSLRLLWSGIIQWAIVASNGSVYRSERSKIELFM